MGDVTGVDDFAYKKCHTYGIIIVNEKTHEPITLLDGRDGNTLREWLKNKKNIKVVIRDRASDKRYSWRNLHEKIRYVVAYTCCGLQRCCQVCISEER